MIKTLYDFPGSERKRNPERKDFKAQFHLANNHKVYLCCVLLLNSDNTYTNMWQVRSEEVIVIFSIISVLLWLRWLSQSSRSLSTSKRFAWIVRHTREMSVFILRFTVRNPPSCNFGKTQLLWYQWSLSTPLRTTPWTSVEPNIISDYLIKRKNHQVSPLLHIQN